MCFWLIVIGIIGLIFGASWAKDLFSGLHGVASVVTGAIFGLIAVLLVFGVVAWFINIVRNKDD